MSNTYQSTTRTIAMTTASVPLVAGASTAVGVLSFSGMHALTSGLIAPALSAGFAVIVEGEVYSHNIVNALKQLIAGDEHIEQARLKKTLQAMYEHQKKGLAGDFHSINQHIKQLQAELNQLSYFDFHRRKNKRKAINRYQAKSDLILKRFRLYIHSGHEKERANNSTRSLLYDDFDQSIEALLKPQNNEPEQAKSKPQNTTATSHQSDAFSKIAVPSEAIHAHCRKMSREIRISQWLKRCLVPIAALAGFHFGITTFSLLVGHLPAIVAPVLALALPGIAVGTTLIASIVWPLAIGLAAVAGVAWTFMIYRTLNDILANEKIQTGLHSLWDTLKNARWYNRLLILSGVTTIGATVVGATVLTAGTWWHAIAGITHCALFTQGLAQALHHLTAASALAHTALTKLPSLVQLAGYINALLTLPSGISLGLFYGNNASESIATIKGLPDFIHAQYEGLQHRVKRKSWGELLNPFNAVASAIELSWKSAVFGLHLVSIAVVGDRFPGIPDALSASVQLFNEFLVDCHYMLDNHEHNHEHNHDHEHNKDHDHGTLCDHDHSHYMLEAASVSIKVAIAPLLAASALWQYAVSQKTNHPYSAKAALVWAFTGHEPHENNQEKHHDKMPHDSTQTQGKPHHQTASNTTPANKRKDPKLSASYYLLERYEKYRKLKHTEKTGYQNQHHDDLKTRIEHKKHEIKVIKKIANHDVSEATKKAHKAPCATS